MFDSLLNSKFYNKCKHAIKCTRTRLDLVRRKKQAMVKFLRKDVADLLANGLESHAFGRMEGLIVEMNQASCYDMIQQYCDYIVKQLNNLQKQSECPQEALEAVSTLVFAAARFPDLPELCDLRHVFTERYGTSIEPFVSSEFVQRLQNKSFTNEEKIQAMQSIAEEFTVPFSTNALERMISGAPKKNHDLLKWGSFNGVGVEASGRNGQKVDKHAVLERQSKSIPERREQKQEIQVKSKNIHVVPDGVDQHGERSRKNYSDKATEKKHMDNGAPTLDVKRGNGTKEIKKDEKNVGQSWRELMNAEELDLNGFKKREVSTAKSPQVKVKKVITPYAEPKGAEKKVATEIPDKKGYHVHRSNAAGGPDHNWGHTDLGLKTLGQERHGIESASAVNGKTANRVPPYSKPCRTVTDESAEDSNGLYNRTQHAGEFGALMQDRKQGSEKAVNMRPPYVRPNSNMRSAHESPKIQDVNGYKHPDSEATGHRRDGVADDDALRPVSVRRRNAKPPVPGDPYDATANEEKTPDQTSDGRGRHSSRRNGHHDEYERRKHADRRNGSASGSDYQTEEDETDNVIDFGNLLPRAPSSHRTHRSRSANPRDGGRDDEERMMDKLLRHYSKKGIDREEHSTRTKSRTPRPRSVEPADGNGERPNREVAPNPPERAASLPAESAAAAPDTKAKAPAPARSISLQPDASRGKVHPNMPDFDELAARISALKKP